MFTVHQKRIDVPGAIQQDYIIILLQCLDVLQFVGGPILNYILIGLNL